MDGNRNQNPPTHYVGIGASAGGLEAIDAFFTHMPARSGLAFIVVQHLSPDYKSLMVELLSKKTAMPVHRAEEGMIVSPDNVYLIPPKKNLTIFHGKLLLKDQDSSRGINLPIDIFLRSLAEDATDRAVAVILSGTGSDGTRGVRAVKEFGGMVMVQSEESAKFDGMPRAAISTGVADFILPPEEMPAQLMAFVEHPYVSREKRSETLLSDENGMTRIFSELRERTKVDFTFYKPSTITRRIERRMTVNQIDDLADYVRFLRDYPVEVMTLYRELLIGVTSFFRDPEAMRQLLENGLPDLLQRAKNREIRFWVAGCSTGEEAYTIAILAKEAMERHKISRDVKIFATDIDRDAIMVAGNGIYPESIAADLTPVLLGKYFYRKDDNYQIVRHVREMVVFAQHNLVKDPPFTKIDLVSCRNLLIYLQPVLQQKALEMFNFSLNPRGLLLLGTSETIGDMSDCFETVHQRFRLYRATGKVRAQPKDMVVTRPEAARYNPAYAPRGAGGRTAGYHGEHMLTRYLEVLASHFLPLSVIVNDQLEVMHIIGNTEGFFKVPSGRADHDITKMASPDLAIPLATGIQKVFRTQQEVSFTNIQLRYMDDRRSLRLRILPLPEKKGYAPLVAVFFEEMQPRRKPEAADADTYDLGVETRQRIRDLEQELQFARENLQATIEELETANEELQATNEELLASNEELQSTNEELQSTNEELYTVNAEYQSKIIELTELNNDVDNLLTHSRIGTLMLDEDLSIRKYSPEIGNVFNILEKDLGRPISHLSHRLVEFDPVATARKVQTDHQVVECDVHTDDGRWYLARIFPYQIGPEAFSGVVMTFVDITELITTRERLDNSRRGMADISQYMPAGLFIYRLDPNGDLVLEASNPEAEKLTGVSADRWGGKRFDDIWPAAGALGLTETLRQVMETGETRYLENVEYTDGDFEGAYRIRAFRLPKRRLAVSFEDISERNRMAAELVQSEIRYHNLFDTMAQGVVYQQADGRIVSANPSAERILGLSMDEMSGRTSMDARWKAVTTDGAALPGEAHPSMVALKTGSPVLGVTMGVYNPKAEETRWIMVNAIPQTTGDPNTPDQVYTTFEDITERVDSERRLDFACRTAGLVWWDWDLRKGLLHVSRNGSKWIDGPSLKDGAPGWFPQIHQDDVPRVRKALDAVLTAHAPEYRERYRLRTASGDTIPVRDHCEVVERTGDGRPARLFGTLTPTDGDRPAATRECTKK